VLLGGRVFFAGIASLLWNGVFKALSAPNPHAINKHVAHLAVRGIRIVVVRDLAKVEARVRFPYPAPASTQWNCKNPLKLFNFPSRSQR
jgi:hypothetical protein